MNGGWSHVPLVLPQPGEKVACDLLRAFVGGEEGGDYGDGVRAGIEDAACIGAGDAADGDQRLAGEGASTAHAFETDDGRCVGLGAGGEDGADSDVVCGGLIGDAYLLGGVGGDADDAGLADAI